MTRPAVKTEVRGVDELNRGLARLEDNIQDEAPRRFEGVADKVKSVTRARVPHKTGAMAASLMARRDGDTVHVGYDGSVPYAGWVEFGGTRGRDYVPGGRWLFPAAHLAEPQLVAAGRDAAHDEIKGMRWPHPT